MSLSMCFVRWGFAFTARCCVVRLSTSNMRISMRAGVMIISVSIENVSTVVIAYIYLVVLVNRLLVCATFCLIGFILECVVLICMSKQFALSFGVFIYGR